MELNTLRDLGVILNIAHDLVCSVLLFTIVVVQIRQHGENSRRLRKVQALLGVPERDAAA